MADDKNANQGASNAPASQSEELTLESLQAQLDTERTANTATKAALAIALEVKADLADALASASGIIDGQKQTIIDLESQLTALQASPSEFAVITVDKVKYEVQAKSFQYNRKDYTADQLVKDTKLQKELVKLGVGFLIKKED